MIKLEGLFAVATFALWVFSLVDVIQTPEGRMRNLPKVGWLLIVLLFPLVGSIAWIVAGRPESRSSERHAPVGFNEYDRPGRMASTDPTKDEEFLRQVRARAEEQRARHEMRRREEQARREGEDPSAT